MKKDIEMPEVSGVYVAVVIEQSDDGEISWDAYLVNDKNESIKNVFVSSKGYLLNLKGEESKSSILRHYYKEVSAKSSQKIEALIDDVLKLNNEYFVSYYFQNKLFDKRFVFLAETIKKEHLSEVPVLAKQGVWIK
jgi:hypothetical protein